MNTETLTPPLPCAGLLHSGQVDSPELRTQPDELAELIDYAIATYNGTPHGGLNNVSPLEAIDYFERAISRRARPPTRCRYWARCSDD